MTDVKIEAREALVDIMFRSFGNDIARHNFEAAADEILAKQEAEHLPSGWRGIESAPKDGTIVTVWGVHEDEYADAKDEGSNPVYRAYPAFVSLQKDRWWMADGLKNIKVVTHWRPRDEGPEASTTGGAK